VIGLNFLGRILQIGLYAAAIILVVVVAGLLVVWAARLSWALVARTWPGPAARLRARLSREPQPNKRTR